MAPDATLTTMATSGVSTLITIAIMPTTMSVNWQSALASSALVIATGKTTVMTISLKSYAMKSPEVTAKCRALSTPSRINRQSTCGSLLQEPHQLEEASLAKHGECTPRRN
jgi:hypothetical protein